MIVVDQNPYHNLRDETLQEAFGILKDIHMQDEEHVRELQEEWGDDWEEILTETFDGKSFVFHDPKKAAEVISEDKGASKYVEIIDSSESM